MKKLDHLSVDGRMLRLFVAVHEEGSVTRGAARSGMAQSAASHALDRLRAAVGDPLFVRSGRGIVATARAAELAADARAVLEGLRGLARPGGFDPATVEAEFVFAANELQRDLVLPGVVRALRRRAPRLDLRIVDGGFENAALLRRRSPALLITPDPPQGSEFVQQRLFDDDWACFFDAAAGPPPDTLARYAARPHAKVVFTEDEAGRVDAALAKADVRRRVALRVSSFLALAPLLRGSDLVAVLPARLAAPAMPGLARCRPPFALAPLNFRLVWHRRDHAAPLHRWVREIVRTTLRGAPGDQSPGDQSPSDQSPSATPSRRGSAAPSKVPSGRIRMP